jgi:N-acetylmuramoyl-L-alanine amidase
MVAVPLQGQGSVVGLLEAFSTEPYGFKDADVRSLNLLAELILAALKPEDEEKMVRAAKVAAAELQTAELESLRQIPMTSPTPPTPPTPPPPPPPTVAPVEPESVPLELSQESIAPPLHDDGGEALRRGALALGIIILLGFVLGAGIWWRFRSVAQAKVNAADHNRNVAIQPSGTASPDTSSLPALSTPGMPTAPSAVPAANPSVTPLITGIDHYAGSGSSTIVIHLQDQVQYEAHRLSDPDRIYFDLLDTTVGPDLNGKIIDVKDGLIGRVRVAQPSENVTRVVLDTKPGSTFAVSLEQNPYRLVIEVRGHEPEPPQPKASVPQTPAMVPQTKIATPQTKEETPVRAHGGKLRIMLDPGHGGWDLGTIGREGLMEKNLVLEVSQRLGALLESRLGCEVVYTRKDDNYIPLEQRAELANREQADLFVSVHANYSSLTTARGVETYYSSFFSPPEAREIESRENGGLVTHAKLTGVQLKDKVGESRKLANDVQRALHGTLSSQNSSIRDRGVREASFVVLSGTEMPSILAEISFVSSPADEEKLRNAEYRQQIAEALYKGIERFAASHRVKVASIGTRPQGQ